MGSTTDSASDVQQTTTVQEVVAQPSAERAPDQEIDISVVIPCLNEVRTVGACIEAAWDGIRAAGLRGEVVIADNGSTDGSRQVATSAGARVVRVYTRGYGAALQTGFLAARGRLLVMGDADLSYDFREIPKLASEQERTGADMVIGDRLGGRIEPGAMPWTHHYLGNPAISFTIRRLFGAPLHDCYCGLRLITRDAHRRLRLGATSMEFALEMIVQASLLGLRFAQVPITLRVDDRDRAPHLRTVRDGYRSFRFLFQHAPITAFGLPGLLAALVGLALVGRAAWLERHGVPATTSASVGTALVQIGWMLAVLGIIARVFVAGFLGGSADPPLKRFFRVAHLETGVSASGVMLAAGLGLAIGFRTWPALFQLGLTFCVAAIGTFIAAFVVSLIGRAVPDNQFADPVTSSPPAPGGPDPRLAGMARADPLTHQNEGHSLATQQALAQAWNYNNWLVESLRGAWEGAGKVLDVGCSIGNVTHIVADRLGADPDSKGMVVGVEVIPEAARRFGERFADRGDLEVVCTDITKLSGELDGHLPFDAAVSFNVLEHIEDDVAALRSIRRLLRPDGRLGLLVPGGGDRLYGTMDAMDRHFRRYTPARLRVRLEAAGFEVLSIRRTNMVGAILWFVKGRLARSREFHAGEVPTFDRLVPAVRRIDALLGPPFGQALAVVARARPPEAGGR